MKTIQRANWDWATDGKMGKRNRRILSSIYLDPIQEEQMNLRLLNTAEQARSHPHRNVVTQALGVTDPQSLRVESLSGELKPGMQLLLCSDGLTEEVDDAGIAKVLRRSDLSAQECVDQLIVAALERRWLRQHYGRAYSPTLSFPRTVDGHDHARHRPRPDQRLAR